ncbi:internalin-like protein (LPXTG motif) Lmo2821 homolog [Nonlabens tegetincola]|uniref:Internalin-like protein (LPXTG motif) Lmo2821 homolog n=1 Tax=Nonlabens tegetincola TaxID=323273 RepID=A0A090Q8A2_9FLAO|nr:T9SS type A sorting domain-containing protein [Nonlabens tegetincola]GAK97958.1 internalin-like protein (LPXTG motif) Lmo2821 homolog [Nonlabens tegetincola]
MKKQLLILLLSAFAFSNFIKAQNVSIPDPSFKSYLVNNTTINTNSDSEISVAEAAAYTGGIFVQNQSISDLTGIEAFTNITRLDCYNNSISTLDLSNNTSITHLQCENNNLTTLIVPATVRHLQAENNDILELDVSNTTNLNLLHVYDNNLSVLNVANNNNAVLSQFECDGNPNLRCIQLQQNFSPSTGQLTLWQKDATATYTDEDCTEAIWYVDELATGSQNGDSWATATTLEDAITFADWGDKIFVKKGTYIVPSTTTALLINTNELKIYGGFDGTEANETQRDLSLIKTTNATVISGDLLENDIPGDLVTNRSENADVLIDLAANDVVIDGFILSGGVSTGGNPVIKPLNHLRNFTLRNSMIKDNLSSGLLLDWRLFSGQLLLENLHVVNNESTNNGLWLIQHNDTNLDELNNKMINLVFADNEYNADFSGIWLRRGTSANGTRLFETEIINCSFINNTNNHSTAMQDGGHTITISGRVENQVRIANTFFYQNRIGSNNNFSVIDIKNVKQNEGTTHTTDIINSALNTDASIRNVNYTGVNVTNVDSSTIDMFLDANYRPTAQSTLLVDLGDNIEYNNATSSSIGAYGLSRLVGGTIDIGALEFDATLSTQDIDKVVDFVIFPNPAIDYITLSSNNTIEDIKIYDVTGKQVKTVISNQPNTIDVSFLPQGLYVVKCTVGDTHVTKKLIVK